MAYRYHATPSTNLIGIFNEGLKQSKRGQYGKGVYFSDSKEMALNWGRGLYGDVNLRILRVNVSNLKGLEDMDMEQSIIRKNIPMENIEILGKDNKWETLENFANRNWRSFGITPNANSRGIGSTSTSGTRR